MISVSYKQDKGLYTYLSVKGHAEFEESGKDLICSAVSSIIFGLMNGLDALNDKITIKQLTNQIDIEINTDNKVAQDYLELVLIQLKTIEESYGNFIKVERK